MCIRVLNVFGSGFIKTRVDFRIRVPKSCVVRYCVLRKLTRKHACSGDLESEIQCQTD